MQSLLDRLSHFLAELKRRKVYRVAVAYLAVAFVGLQAVNLLVPSTTLPTWADELLLAFLILGFPVTMVVAWAFELTPDGIRRSSPPEAPAAESQIRGGSPVERPTRRRAYLLLASLLLLGVLGYGGMLVFGSEDGTGAEVPQIRSLAVLPLDNLSGDPDQAYFTDGMTEALIAELSHIGALKVISRTSVMRYKGTDKSLPEIAAELGVEGIVEGSVLRAKDRVRVTVQLLHGPTDRHLWSESYERDLRDILALHSKVARAVAEQIQVTLAPQEAEPLSAERVVDPAAYEEYLKGQYHWNKLTREGWKAAIDHFQQSIEEDPSYAPAHAMMSLAYSLLGYYSGMPPAVLHSRALAAAERAVALDSSLAQAHASLAMVKTSFDWDWAAADRASRKALRLNPNSRIALFSRAIYLNWVGRHEEAIAVAKRAAELDPVAPWANTTLGMHYFMARRYDEAIEQLSDVVALEPEYHDAYVWLCYSYTKKGMFEKAAGECSPSTSGWLEVWLLASSGKSAEARSALERAPAEVRDLPIGAYFMAIALGELGEKDRAFALLERAYHGRSPLMSALKIDPRIDALRDDPRFQDLLRGMDFPETGGSP